MSPKEIVSEILLNAANGIPEKAYRNVYFIKIIDGGDKKNLFVSFRYKLTNIDAVVCWVDIDLERIDRNVLVGMSYLKVRERKSVTFFKKGLVIPRKNIVEMIQQDIAPLLSEKLSKAEAMYGKHPSSD